MRGAGHGSVSLFLPVEMERFVCRGCKNEYDRPESFEQLDGRERNFWEKIRRAETNNHFQCEVQCPNFECKRDNQQCLRCNYSIHHDSGVLTRSNRRRSPEDYVNNHLREVHRVTAKVQKLQHGRCQVIFPSGADPDSAHGLAGLASESAVYDDDWSLDDGRSVPSLLSRRHDSDSDCDSDCSSTGSFDDYNLTEWECKAGTDLCLAREEEETKDAARFVDQYQGLNLDPNEPPSTESAERKEVKLPEVPDRHKFSDFHFFDWRGLNQRDHIKHPPCQIQAYFYQRYLAKHDDSSDDSGGLRGLLHRLQQRDLCDLAEMADKDESRVYFKLFNLFMESKGDRKDELIEVCQGIINLFTEHSPGICPVKAHFPQDLTEARNFFTEGAYSLFKYFPVPNVFPIDGHACVSLKQVILIAAGHGAKFNFAHEDGKTKTFTNPLTEGLNATKAVEDLVLDVLDAVEKGSDGVSPEERRKTKIGYVYFWSDGFLNCFIKQKDNSVWIFTVTVCPPVEEKSSGKYTYVLAMGQGGTDHTKVVEHYMKECQDLMKGFPCYFGDTNTLGRMAIGHLYSSADRPERQEIGHTMKEGTYGKVSGWSAPIDEEFLPACTECHKQRLKEIQGQTAPSSRPKTCDKCADWTFKEDEHRTVPLPKSHPFHPQKIMKSASDMKRDRRGRWQFPKGWQCPKGREPTESGRIGPVRLSGNWLTESAEFAYNMAYHGYWTPKDASEFLRSCNVRTSLAAKISERARADGHARKKPDCKELIPFVWKMKPDFFGRRHKQPDMPMHGLAHGIIPDVMNVLHQILARYGKFTAFVNFANPIIEDVANMRLDYCKVKQLPKAAWIAENVMGYARMMPYLYGMFLSNTPLQSRALEQAEEITKNMRRLLNSLGALCSVLMSRNTIAEERVIDNHMKLFMSSAHLLHISLGPTPLRQDKNKNTKDLIDKLTTEETKMILRAFSKDSGDNKKTRAKQIRKISNVQLLSKCTEMKLEPPTRNARKIQLQTLVFGEILGRSVHVDREEGNDTDHAATLDHRPLSNQVSQETTRANASKEKRCWNKGAWLSFTANLPKQIHYAGPCPLLW